MFIFFRRTWAAASRHMARSGRSDGRRAATVAAHGSCSSSIDLSLSLFLFYYRHDWSKAADWRWGTVRNSVKSSGVVTSKAYIFGVLPFSDKGSFVQQLRLTWLTCESCCTVMQEVLLRYIYVNIWWSYSEILLLRYGTVPYQNKPEIQYWTIQHHEQCDRKQRGCSEGVEQNFLSGLFPLALLSPSSYLTWTSFLLTGLCHAIDSLYQGGLRLPAAFPKILNEITEWLLQLSAIGFFILFLSISPLPPEFIFRAGSLHRLRRILVLGWFRWKNLFQSGRSGAYSTVLLHHSDRLVSLQQLHSKRSSLYLDR